MADDFFGAMMHFRNTEVPSNCVRIAPSKFRVHGSSFAPRHL
jgi:hypothetical protein